MSSPEIPSLFSASVPTFGGYALEENQVQGVGFWPRVGARVIDMVIHYIVSFLSGILFVIMLVVASGGHPSRLALFRLQHTGLAGFAFALLGSFAYHVVFTSIHGSTVGKIALGMAVVQEDGTPCSFKSALIRELGYFVDGLFFGIIGYMAMQKTVQEQRHGDEWADTVVTKRSQIRPENLRGLDRFFLGLVLAMIADSACAMLGMLFALAG